MKCSIIIFCFFQIFGVQTLIVPDEIPTILSVIYSNIPVIKKGTDSRLGWGFRLGDRADFQVLVELGPQTYTQPLANQEDKNANSKRNAVNSLSDTLYAQRQKDKKKQQEEKSGGGSWLETWSKSIRQPQNGHQDLPPGAQPGLAIGEIDAKSVIPDDATLKLAQLYVEKKQDENIAKSDDSLKLTKLYQAETTTVISESGTESSTAQGE